MSRFEILRRKLDAIDQAYARAAEFGVAQRWPTAWVERFHVPEYVWAWLDELHDDARKRLAEAEKAAVAGTVEP